jgi:phosphohistidine phosphatase SixA
MVTRVVLVRHGQAGEAALDGERALTARGRADAERLAQWCAALAVAPAEIRHSGLLRAAQTAEILAAALAPPRGVRAVRGLAPEDDAASMAEELAHEHDALVLVTHMPFVADLAGLLARRAPMSFAPAAAVVFDRDGDAWRLTASWQPD